MERQKDRTARGKQADGRRPAASTLEQETAVGKRAVQTCEHIKQKAPPTSAPKSLPSNYHLRQTGPLLEPRTTWDQLVHYSEVSSSSESGSVTKPTTESEQGLGTIRKLQRLKTVCNPGTLAGPGRSSQSALQGKGQETPGLLFPACLPLGPSKSASAASGQPEPRTKCRRTRINTVPPRLSIPFKDKLSRCVILVKEPTAYVKAQRSPNSM